MRQKLLLLGAVVFGLLAFVLTYRQLEAEKRRILGDSETVVLIRITRNMVENEEIREGLSLYVGTPGRLIDFARSHKIDFRMFSTVVLDEADRMFDMGFYPDIQKMFSMMVGPTERQTMLLSATLSIKVRNIAWDYMNEPLELESQPEEITVDKITQELFHVTRDEEFSLLLQILHKHNPKSTLIFTNTKDRAVEVSERLRLNGYKSAYLMGDMKQSERLKALDRLKEGQLQMLVATDVAARGLQIDDLELVVNYDLPEDYENYVHRIGRTARAGKSGRAISFASEEYVYSLEAIEEYIHMKIPVCWPDEYGLEEVEKPRGVRGRLAQRARRLRGGRRQVRHHGQRPGPDGALVGALPQGAARARNIRLLRRRRRLRRFQSRPDTPSGSARALRPAENLPPRAGRQRRGGDCRAREILPRRRNVARARVRDGARHALSRKALEAQKMKIYR